MTKVIVDGSNLVAGDEYDLLLESYDSAGTVQSTLKTDIIKIIVDPNCKATTSVQALVIANHDFLTQPI